MGYIKVFNMVLAPYAYVTLKPMVGQLDILMLISH